MDSKLLAMLVVLSVVLVVPTVAVSVGNTGVADGDTTGDLQIVPSDTSNGQYASVENGEIRLDLEGLNARATTSADDVFTITSTSESVEAVWIENEIDGVTFYPGSDRDTELGRSNRLHLERGETASVGVSVDTRVADEGTASFAVRAEMTDGASSIVGTDFDVSPTTVTAGESVSATITLENRGDRTGTRVVDLTVDGEVVDRRAVELDPGERRTVSFERTMDHPGTYEVGLEGRSETVTVVEPTADVSLVDLDVSTDRIEVGEVLTVTATYENRGEAAGTTTAELTVDGIVVDRREVAVGAGERVAITFERTMERTGSYEVGIGETSRRVVVSLPDGPSPDFAVTNATVEPGRIAPGERIAASAVVENRGNTTGEFTAELAVGGVVVETTPVELEPNESRTATFRWRLDEPGTYAVAVSGADAGSVTVAERGLVAAANRTLLSQTAAAVAPVIAACLLFLLAAARRRVDL